MKMSNKSLVCLGMIFLSNPALFSIAMALPFQPHTPQLSLELQSVLSLNTYQTAATYWLPDWQRKSSGNASNGGGDSLAKKNCSSYGYVSSCPADMIGTLIHPTLGLNCYKNCTCIPSLPLGAGEVCTKYCSSNCIAKGCKTAVTITYANDTCTEKCASDTSVCTAKSCSPACTSSSSAPYGTYTQDNRCGSTCNIAYADNCRNRMAVSCGYGCQSNWNDCSSKCRSCYADNCRNRTAVSVPSNATCTTKFSDCSSKCSAFTCNSGYNQSGNTCVPATCAIGDVYHSDRTCSASIISGKTPIGVVGYITNGGRNGLVLALEETQKTWSNENYDLPCLEDTRTPQSAWGGKENTACIVQTKNSRSATYDAGIYCANYNIGGIRGWFLPASGELYNTIYLNIEWINGTFSRLDKTKIDVSGSSYWSSSQYSSNLNAKYYNNAWYLRPSDGSMTYNYGSFKKNSTFRVRCVLDF